MVRYTDSWTILAAVTFPGARAYLYLQAGHHAFS